MFHPDFARTTMWFMPSAAPLLRELIEAATDGGDSDDLDLDTIQSPAENDAPVACTSGGNC